MTDQTPNDGLAEQSLLGCLMKDPSTMDRITDIIRSADAFYYPKHRLIWKSISDMHGAGQPIDITTLATAVKDAGNLEKIGGRTYLVELIEAVCSTQNVEAYARTVADKYSLRRAIEVGENMMTSARQQGRRADELLDHFETQIMAITDAGRNAKQDALCVSDVAQEYIDSALNRDPARHDRWIETRVADLNRRILGLFRGDMTIIAGPPSMMKTAFAIDICEYNRQFGHKSLFISLDQTREAFVYRLVSSLTGIPKRVILGGRMTDAEKDRVCKAGVTLSTMKEIMVTERTDRTVLDIRAEARRVKREKGLDIMVIDYVQMIPPHKAFDNRNLELTEISRILKATAKELDIALILLSQLNRTYAAEKINVKTGFWAFPNRSMLRDSGSLEQDANVILFPWIPDILLRNKFGDNSVYYKTIMQDHPELLNKAFIVVDKMKDGETGIIECWRDPERMRLWSPSDRSEPHFEPEETSVLL